MKNGILVRALMALTTIVGVLPGIAISADLDKGATKAIDAILYSNSSREEMLIDLKPYAEPMQSMDDVRTRLALGFCFGTGPGVMQCEVAHSGLTLVFDPDKKLRLIRRSARLVNGVAYPEMSVTDRGFEWHGYQRWYEN